MMLNKLVFGINLGSRICLISGSTWESKKLCHCVSLCANILQIGYKYGYRLLYMRNQIYLINNTEIY